MAKFPDRFITQVAEATDIVELIGQFVALKKRGKEFLGLCPFHDDHRPSLNVSPAKQIFKCFVCGAGGGVFQFLMRLQKLAFPEAVRQLAGRAGIPVPQSGPAEGGDRRLSRAALQKLMVFAAKLYRDRLFAQAGQGALAYVRGRALTDESIKRFGLGFAPEGWEILRSAAGEAGFTDRQLLAAGLVSQRQDGSCYDRFRKRLVFPIFDVEGKVIAFGGRALDEDEHAKYLNSPETVLFDKSANLYGLNWSRQAIVGSGQAVVVEGYFDALMCLQAGVDNVVATLGTALTPRHVQLLARYAREVVLVFDADAAGEAAAERAIELFLTQRLQVRVATVPQSPPHAESQVKDPCDYVLAAGAESFRQLLGAAPDALEYAWLRRREDYRRADSLAGKRQIVEDFLRLVVSSAAYGAIDALRQGLLAGRLAELVGVSPTDLAGLMRQVARRVRRAAPAKPAAAEAEFPGRTAAAERAALGALLNEPQLFERVRDRLDPAMFSQPLLREIAQEAWRLAGEDGLDLAHLMRTEQAGRWGQVAIDLQTAAESRGNGPQTLDEAVELICRRRQQEHLEELKARKDGDQAEMLREVSQQARRPDLRRHPRIY